MTFSLTSWFATTEQEVVDIIAEIKQDGTVADSDITKALNWVASKAPEIVQALQTAVGLATAVGVVTAPELAAANAAVAALNAFAAVQNNSTGTLTADAKAVIQGYVAYQNANAAVATASANAASSPNKAA